MSRRRHPAVLPPGGPIVFPDPRGAGKDGLLLVGGDLSPARLLLAYDSGIFPWYDSETPPLWWSPDPRAVLELEHLHVSRSLRRRLRKRNYELSVDRAFRHVMEACADRSEGTWILPEMVDAYEALHRAGHAHSFEVWMDGSLAGGLYGVRRGGLFAAESMFHSKTDASKIALVAAVRSLYRAGVQLIDVQFVTSHLASFGAREIARAEYLLRIAELVPKASAPPTIEPVVD